MYLIFKGALQNVQVYFTYFTLPRLYIIRKTNVYRLVTTYTSCIPPECDRVPLFMTQEPILSVHALARVKLSLMPPGPAGVKLNLILPCFRPPAVLWNPPLPSMVAPVWDSLRLSTAF